MHSFRPGIAALVALAALADSSGCTEPLIERGPDAGDGARDSGVNEAATSDEPDADELPPDAGDQQHGGAHTLRMVPDVIAGGSERLVRLERANSDRADDARRIRVPEGFEFRYVDGAEILAEITIPAGESGVDVFLRVQADPPDSTLDTVRKETIRFTEHVAGDEVTTEVSFELRAGAAHIAQGAHTTCVVVRGGLQCMGRTGYGEAGLPRTPLTTFATPHRIGPAYDFMQVSMEGDFSCAIDDRDRAVWCWGKGAYGALGQVSADSSVPLRVPSVDAHAENVDVGPAHACASREDGSVYCWGRNDREQVRPGASDFAPPTRVEGLPEGNYTIAVGEDFSCAMSGLPFQELYCWGANDVGQLGRGDVGGSSATPVFIDISVVNAYEKFVRAAGRSVCIVGSNRVFCWGDPVLLPGRTEPSGKPILVAEQVHEPFAISATTACIGMAEGLGGVGCWGKNTWQSLQTGRLEDPASPALVEGLPGGVVTSISTGGHDGRSHCAVIDGLPYCWGFHPDGELGLDARLDDVLSPRPSVFLNDLEFDSLHSIGYGDGDGATCVLLEDAPLRCWGWAKSGQLAAYSAGYDLEAVLEEPTELVSSGAPFKDFEIGDGFVIGTDGYDVRTWGAGPHGELGNGTVGTATQAQTILFDVPFASSHVTRVAAGQHHACVIAQEVSEPGLYCWGDNTSGQLGVPSITDYSAQPVRVLAGAVADVDAASTHTCAIAAGKAMCWGSNLDTPYLVEPSAGEQLPDFVQVGVAGPARACARSRFEAGSAKHTGEVWCWYGEGHPSLIGSHFSDLRASGTHTCALQREDDLSDLYCWGSNDFGQLGTGDRDDYDYLPRRVAGLGRVKRFALAGGDRSSTCAEDESGWKCWGNALRRQFEQVPWVAAPTLMLPWQE